MVLRGGGRVVVRTMFPQRAKRPCPDQALTLVFGMVQVGASTQAAGVGGTRGELKFKVDLSLLVVGCQKGVQCGVDWLVVALAIRRFVDSYSSTSTASTEHQHPWQRPESSSAGLWVCGFAGLRICRLAVKKRESSGGRSKNTKRGHLPTDDRRCRRQTRERATVRAAGGTK